MTPKTPEDFFDWMKNNSPRVYENLDTLESNSIAHKDEDENLYRQVGEVFDAETGDPSRIMITALDYLYQRCDVPSEICKIISEIYFHECAAQIELGARVAAREAFKRLFGGPSADEDQPANEELPKNVIPFKKPDKG